MKMNPMNTLVILLILLLSIALEYPFLSCSFSDLGFPRHADELFTSSTQGIGLVRAADVRPLSLTESLCVKPGKVFPRRSMFALEQNVAARSPTGRSDSNPAANSSLRPMPSNLLCIARRVLHDMLGANQFVRVVDSCSAPPGRSSGKFPIEAGREKKTESRKIRSICSDAPRLGELRSANCRRGKFKPLGTRALPSQPSTGGEHCQRITFKSAEEGKSMDPGAPAITCNCL